MRGWRGCWLVMLLTAGPAAVFAGATPSREADERTIVYGERAWGQAFVTGDLAVVERLLADDFGGVSARGEVYDKAAS